MLLFKGDVSVNLFLSEFYFMEVFKVKGLKVYDIRFVAEIASVIVTLSSVFCQESMFFQYNFKTKLT